MSLPNYEKLGAFYLGRTYDLAARKRRADLVLYDSKDLVTHGVCVGMTGSGKTGLCIGLLEEAAIDGIPALVIDPKGDLSNLLLTFPQLRPADFAPWINADDARKKGVTPEAFAAQQAERWRNGLAEWDQDGPRIQRLRDAADFAIYTPGSNAGLPISVLKSFDPPPPAILDDGELFNERVSSTVTSLLALLNIAADPLQSREHILVSNLLADAWQSGRSLDLPGLIAAIQKPPMTRVGVLELESFFPAKDRFTLALQINNLIAAPGFSRWTEGAPLDIGAFLYTPTGKPRISIFSIAHLGDAERMFFVSLLLNQTLGWVRTQSGTSSLRAIVYMDEIAGYFPPIANPPSKQPLLTLMKQARAFGVGILVATQNPVDLDYKGLANAGTWFIGRLQTERDKARVLDGLEGAAASASAKFDRASMEQLLSQLGSRVFLMNNVHDDAPEIIETRWAMSYLRGPLTRDQIKTLMDPLRDAVQNPASDQSRARKEAVASDLPDQNRSAAPRSNRFDPASPIQNLKSKIQNSPLAQSPRAAFSKPTAAAIAAAAYQRPVLPPEIPQYFLPTRLTPSDVVLAYQPMLYGRARIYYQDARLGVEAEQVVAYLSAFQPGPVPIEWDEAETTELAESDLEHDPTPEIGFADLPAPAGKPKSFDAWKKSLADMLYRRHTLELLRSPEWKLTSAPAESERDFRMRIAQAAREDRDSTVEKLRQKFAPRLATLRERIRRADQAVAVQREQAGQAKVQTAISFGSAILGAFLGRKATSAGNVGRAATAARGVGRSMKESGDIGRAEETARALQAQLADLEAEFQAQVDTLDDPSGAATATLEPLSVKPKKTNITIRTLVLAWAPHRADASGTEARAWE